jgi:hypothetical protein
MSDVSFCQQRSLAQINNRPENRFNPINPYTTTSFTKFQLDMRRKVETLKYSANKSSTQTNNMSKKEKFALLVRGGMSRAQAVIQSNIIDCSGDRLIPTPTTASGVPGPVMYLYEDETVPLYNYSDFNSRSYSSGDSADTPPWQFVSNPNVLAYDNGSSNVYYLIINRTIGKPEYNFKIVMPIGIAVAGVVPSPYSSSPSDFSGNIKIRLTSATLSVYYGSGLVKNIVIPYDDLSGIVMDVNLPTSNLPTPQSFSATSFLGNLVFSNIQLYTEPTYVYKFALSVNLTVAPSTSRLIQYTALVANITNYNNVSEGPITINNASSAVYSSPSIIAV